jgi:hypothetical protein
VDANARRRCIPVIDDRDPCEDVRTIDAGHHAGERTKG